METLKHLSVKKHEGNDVPLLADADSAKSPGIKHWRESSQFFLTQRWKNLGLSFTLLLSCYSAILVPAYLPTKQLTWTESSTEDYLDILNRSAALLSRPCISGFTKTKLQKVLNLDSLLQIPVFLQNETRHWELAPPLGLLGSEGTLAQTLRVLPHSGLPSVPDRCRRCMVVGSGGILHAKHLGAHIDKYDIIIRINNAPVFGFEEDAGSRTTIRLTYPEAASFLQQEYQNTDIVAVVVFKRLDLEWLTSIVTKKPLSWWTKLWFWRDVVSDIPLQPGNFRILNPEILSRTWHVMQNYGKHESKTVPTLGFTGIVVALQLCDEVSMAGFGYDFKHPGSLLHYYGTVRMDHMMAQVVHDVSAERSLLRGLVKSGVVHDVTGAL
ncbi:ST3 beta-galactoside alpha-2,3-sialyltransferase 7 isoform X1 [Ictalurus punctatus]|uniref:Lactosylceramide alpha-2,3-sialyltransferase n=1 Tax=Ictalurus punctatus TaxID=7998 RepID=A0A2D0QNQ7_ICTPU|nr:ST3 beta-galactoside alpha-2,3-sialyltransferase 7 isoform X1 [Ictalurus punctatus]